MTRLRAVALGIVLAAPPLAAQGPADAIRSLEWRSIGPANMGGRIADIEGIPGDPSTYYLAPADGGIFKTTNGGVTFEALFTDQVVYSVGEVEVAPSDHNILWVGTGEGDPRNSASFGNGVYRSLDGGRSWTHLGLEDTERIKRIAVHPDDANTAYVCALGHAWGPNEQRGVFKTTDGGETWEKVLYRDQDTGCSEIVMHPSNPRILYAGMYTFRRRPWRYDGGGGETGLYKSTDAGATWMKLTNGLPDVPMDRVGVAVAPSDPDIVYMIGETAEEGILFRSEDAGASWEMVNDDPRLVFRPFYYSDLRVDPENADRVYSLAGDLFVSDDGGRTFRDIGDGVHGDHQAFWIDPENPERLLSGSDGGYQVSYDRGETWDIGNTLAISQFYQIFHDDRKPYYVCGGLQDNGNWCGPSNSLSGDGILKDDWYTVSGGDGFYTVPVPGQPHLVYSNSQGGNIHLTDIRSGMTRSIVPYPKDFGSFGGAVVDARYRYNWNAPIHISPHDPNTVYFGGNVLFRSTDYGQSWEVISPDLTTDDPAKQQSSGGPVTADNTAAEFHTTILTIEESPVTAGVIWVGTDDGNVQVTRDGGQTWTNVIENARGLPPHSWISRIDASNHEAGTAYVAVDRHRDDDFTPRAYRVTDYGETWTDISAGLPELGYVHVVREDPRNPNLLYAGTENGLYASWDRGETWHSIRNNLPPVAVRDIKVHPRENDLIIGTHGRGAWILDDITPLQQLAAAGAAEAHLFPVRPAVRWEMWSKDADFGDRHFEGENPPYGALIRYSLRAPGPVTFAVSDASGAVIREWTEDGAAGVNQAVWDLEHAAPTPAASDDGRGRRRGGGGPMAIPGEYTLTLRAAGQELSTPIRVEADPRVQVAQADYAAQLQTLLELRDLTSRANGIIDRTESLRKQLTALDEALGTPAYTAAGASAAVGAAVKTALDEVAAFRATLTRQGSISYREPPQLRDDLSSLSRQIGGAPGRPTAGQLERLEELKVEVREAAAALQDIVSTHVAQINRGLSDQPHIVVGGMD